MALVTQVAGAQGAEPSATPPVSALIVLIGPGPARTAVRQVIAEWLEREGTTVSWSSQESFHADDLFEPSEGFVGIRAWIDLSSGEQVRLYFRDATSRWFVIRALQLASGLDEIGREEIGHVVSSAVIALASGPDNALSEPSARAELHMTPAPPAAPLAVPRDESPGLRLEMAGLGGLQLHARDKLLTRTVSASFAVTRGPLWGKGRGSPGAWLDLGYQLPATYAGNAAGADLSAASLRAGLLWEIRSSSVFLLRVALGGGVDRVQYRPTGDTTAVKLAPASHFWIPVASFWVGPEVRVAEHVGLALRISVDLALARVHYDVGNANGAQVETLEPYRVRPGLSLAAAFPF